MAALDVWLYGQRAGRLERTGSQLSYTYDEAWTAAQRPPLSHSMPLRAEPYEHEVTHSFFANLLPEGEVRELVARRFGVSVGNDFELLAAIGGDCAGAISLTVVGAEPGGSAVQSVDWLDEAALADVLADLPRRPFLADPEDGIRLSLAGAQDKLPVVIRDGRIGIPKGGSPTTHILKAPITRLTDTVVNEGFCLRFAGELGLTAAKSGLRSVADHEFLVVERYDRVVDADPVERLHQEDFCQALGVPPERKYQSEGGPGLGECADVIRRATSTPAQDLLALTDAVSFNYLIGNHDAHGKNFSLLYLSDETRVAPLYDLVSTAAYPELTRKMAMKLGREYRPEYVRRRHVEAFASEAGLGVAATRARMLRSALVASDVAENVREDFRLEGWYRPILDDVVGIIKARARHLERELGRSQAAGASR